MPCSEMEAYRRAMLGKGKARHLFAMAKIRSAKLSNGMALTGTVQERISAVNLDTAPERRRIERQRKGKE